MRQHGLGVSMDLKKAVQLYNISASRDYAPAQTNLGSMYLRGIGVTASVYVLSIYIYVVDNVAACSARCTVQFTRDCNAVVHLHKVRACVPIQAQWIPCCACHACVHIGRFIAGKHILTSLVYTTVHTCDCDSRTWPWVPYVGTCIHARAPCTRT